MLERTVYSEDHEIFRSTVKKFVEKEIVPFHSQWEKDGVVGATCKDCSPWPGPRTRDAGSPARGRRAPSGSGIPLLDVPLCATVG